MPPSNGGHAWTPNSYFPDSNGLQQATTKARLRAEKPNPTVKKGAAARQRRGKVKRTVDTTPRRITRSCSTAKQPHQSTSIPKAAAGRGNAQPLDQQNEGQKGCLDQRGIITIHVGPPGGFQSTAVPRDHSKQSASTTIGKLQEHLHRSLVANENGPSKPPTECSAIAFPSPANRRTAKSDHSEFPQTNQGEMFSFLV